MANAEIHPEENDYEDGDHDQFDLGTSFDDLESGYFENQTHLPADIQAKYEEESIEGYEEEFGSDEDLNEGSAKDLETESDSKWSDAIEVLKLRKESLDRLTKERKIALDEFNKARSQLFLLLDSNNTDKYTTNDYTVRKITRKGRVSYKNAMFDICGGETDLFTFYSDKHRGKAYNTLSIRETKKPPPR